ncbi:glycoside hydrolase family 97 N-terminal domain-containing protein [Sphingobacterium sp. DN00404]|uniref:Glycoside hydrolase family 97 N-terminal domain-containing protein n=1 Tax=Sphingobacterium micropteri TaxID=2763501 RepID=A0ABR7YIV9_9SPHI|nr:glycoside hydrolase family 97 protein [Sphingobacterium micropteri]MBD1431261.1 glycoside hydrolase family 97 N-terminal domain-containing protein [Sphingobacterium micropteri]
MMYKSGLIIFLISMAFYSNAQTILENTIQQLASPDGNYQYTLYQKQFPDNTKQLFYSVSYKGKSIIKESELGVLIENQLFESALAIPNDTSKIWGENLSLTDVETRTVNETWTPVYGERNKVKNHYNELVLKFQKGGVPEAEGISSTSSEGQGQAYDKRQYYYMDFIVRAYDEGVAFRYFFPEATNGLFLHIVGEQTQFTLPEGTMAYHEHWAQAPSLLKPLNDWDGESERPLTMKLANGLTVALLEAEMIDYARMKFRLAKENTLQASLYSSVDVITPYATPWRVIMASEKPTTLIENNDIVLNLNPPNKIEDTSWIKPGKVIRVARLTQADAIKCIDFAAERNLQYIHIDAGWYGSEVLMASDATSVAENRDFDMPELISYAASKGIGVWVYVNQRALLQQLDQLLPLYQKWGLKGIKFGFVQIGNQRWSTWLHDAIRKCAEYGLQVDIHDEYRPTGFSRTYPNLLTQEGIHGNEEFPDATNNTILPYTRFLAGAGDYTICYYDPRIKTTHAHQLALSVIYYSPLQFLYWYDQPSAYQGEPEIAFFDKVKTVWDDTKVLNGEIGEYITMARRSGEEWFIGAIGNNEAQQISVSFDFLDKGKTYLADIYIDDDSIDSRTKVGVSQMKMNAATVKEFNLKPSGGVTLHVYPKK